MFLPFGQPVYLIINIIYRLTVQVEIQLLEGNQLEQIKTSMKTKQEATLIIRLKNNYISFQI